LKDEARRLLQQTVAAAVEAHTDCCSGCITYNWHQNRAALKDEAWRLLPAAASEASPSSFAGTRKKNDVLTGTKVLAYWHKSTKTDINLPALEARRRPPLQARAIGMLQLLQRVLTVAAL